jgi:selenocysteine lyase/cysteine desulfurase
MKVYLDNAATSYPKPEKVAYAVMNYITNIGANPGRGGFHLHLKEIG